MTYERTTVIHDHCLLEETILLYIKTSIKTSINSELNFTI